MRRVWVKGTEQFSPSEGMQFQSSLIGQEESVQILSQVLQDPPHIFLSGYQGCGKTTLMNEFLRAYYAQFEISNPGAEWILWLSSEQDRGIHCVRQSVAEFVRHSSSRPGVYRWIVVDDADSLPMISQQALRRPMETHAHTTRFIFCSNHSNDLIQPLRSRCLHLELDLISPMMLIEHFTRLYGNEKLTFSTAAIGLFLSFAHTPTEMKHMAHILAEVYRSDTPRELQSEDILSLFASPSFTLCMNLIKAQIRKQHDQMMRIFLEIWTTGISYEDFLYELTSSVKQLGMVSPLVSQKIHQLILKGWIYFAQGKTHSLDLMRLFFEETI